MAKRDYTLTAEEVGKLLRYDPETGDLFWKVRADSGTATVAWNKRFAGKRAGSMRKGQAYCIVRINRHAYLGHRLIWLILYGEWPEHSIDHADGDPSNNRISNLRAATHAENMQNIKKRADNRSGFTGVSWSAATKKWRSDICIRGQRLILGYFNTPQAASSAYLLAKARVHEFQPAPRET